MNSARLRRPRIAQKARKAMLRRLWSQRKTRKKGQDLVMPLPKKIIEGRVYLDYGKSEEPLVYTSLWVSFQEDKVASTIEKMQRDGFWAPRPQKGEMIFIPAGRILQVHLSNSDRAGY